MHLYWMLMDSVVLVKEMNIISDSVVDLSLHTYPYVHVPYRLTIFLSSKREKFNTIYCFHFIKGLGIQKEL